MKKSTKTPPTGKSEPKRRPAASPREADAPATELAPIRFHIRRILVPVDFSEPSRKAFRYARLFAEQFGAELVLLHVVEPVLYPADFGYLPVAAEAAERERLEDLSLQLERLAAEVHGAAGVEKVVRLGRAWKVITDFAAERSADLVVVSTHGYTGLQHALLGSVAEKIVRHAPCPVLVVREQERDFA